MKFIISYELLRVNAGNIICLISDIICTHDIKNNCVLYHNSMIDFLNPAIKQYGQALLDIPRYKLLIGTDGPNLKETANLYDLTEAEQELLLAKKRGHALFMVGAKRLHINFEIPDYKMEYMGKAGGR